MGEEVFKPVGLVRGIPGGGAAFCLGGLGSVPRRRSKEVPSLKSLIRARREERERERSLKKALFSSKWNSKILRKNLEKISFRDSPDVLQTTCL